MVADPGLPIRRLGKLDQGLREALSRTTGRPVRLYIESAELKFRPDDTLDFTEVRGLADTFPRVDAVVILTEIPRSTAHRPLVAEVFTDEGIAVVSYPTFGYAKEARLHQVISDCVYHITSKVDFASFRAGPSWGSW